MIFGSCTQYTRGLTRWAELLGRRRRRRQLVSPGGYRPPDPPPCLISKEQVLAQMVWEPKRSKPMVQMGRKSTGSNPSVFPDSQVIPECLVLQYFQIHRSYQNAWSFSISRFTGPQNAWSSDAQSISSDTQHKRYKFRHPKYKFRHPKYKFRHPKYSGISSDTQSISSDTQSKAIFQDPRLSKWIVFRYFQIHRL